MPVVPPGEIDIVTISLYEASVGVFVPYLGNLSGLLDHASAYAEARNTDPAVLLNMRLSPTMYSLKQQVGEANRHAVVAGALLAGRAPPSHFQTPSPTSPSSRRKYPRRLISCKICRAPRSKPQRTRKSLSLSRMVPSEHSPEKRCC
jgi:hypothetical protein